MADNTVLNSGTGGDRISTIEHTFSGDSSKTQLVALAGASGSEGSWTVGVVGGDATNGLDVDVTRVPTDPFGANADAASATGSISAKLRFIAATGIPVTSIAAGDNNIGNVDIASSIPAGTNNIGDVDVLSVVPGTGATALGKAIDSAAGATDTGVAVLAVRDDSLSALTPADGDYTNLRVDSTGALHVRVSAGGIAGKAEDAAHTTADEGVVILAVRRDSASSGVDTDGDYATLSVDANGNLRTTGSSGVTSYTEDGASAGGESLVLMGAVRRDTAASSSGTDGDYSTLNTDASGRLHVNVGNTVTVASHAVTNAGTFAVQVDGNALTALQLIDNTVLVDDAAFTPATSSVNVAGYFADEASTDSVDEGDIGAARMTLDRKLIVAPQPHTAGGLSIFRSIDLDETEEEAKGTAGCVYGMWVTNTATSTRFIKFYNATAANVTVGTTTPVITIGIPGNTSDDVSGNFGPGGMGVTFDTAITLAATTGVADADTGAPGANEVIVNLFYK